MGGFFGVVSAKTCVQDLFFGTDYHSHLGNLRGGMMVWGDKGFRRFIHDITNAQFRSKFQDDIGELESTCGTRGIGCISDSGDQPLIVSSHLGTFGITTVGQINNLSELSRNAFRSTRAHFAEITIDGVNPTEMVASLISLEANYADGIRSAQDKVQGSCSMLLLTKDGIYAARDRYGRTPVVIGQKSDGGMAATFETCALDNLGYRVVRWLKPGEAVLLHEREGIQQVLPPRKTMRMCAFLWIYYGFPASSYEDINVEDVRYRCGMALARRDGKLDVDAVVGVPDSGTAHALGYSHASGLPYKRSFAKYTPTWPRSFIPSDQLTRELVAQMKLIAIERFIRDQKLLFCEDSIVRGTQLRDTFRRLPELGAKEIHVRSACPPILFNCKYLNFTRARALLELAARRAIQRLEGDCEANLDQYRDHTSEKYAAMVECIREDLGLMSLKYQHLDDMIAAIGIPGENLCTYCWDGRERENPGDE